MTARLRPYLERVVGRSDGHLLVVADDDDTGFIGLDVVRERSLEGHVGLTVGHCPRPEGQSGRHVLLVSGVDPE